MGTTTATTDTLGITNQPSLLITVSERELCCRRWADRRHRRQRRRWRGWLEW